MNILLKKIPPKYFILSQLFILIVSLAFLFGIHYIVNIQYKVSDKPFAQGPVTSKPKSFTLNIAQPDENTLVFDKEISLSGQTGPNMEVLVSTNTDNMVIKSKTDGSFSTSLTLTEGVNNIKIVVFDQTGDFREAERTIYYSKEKI